MSRRAEPISKHTARNGTVSYRFRLDVGENADGTRRRERFTFPTMQEARREYRRLSTEVARGDYVTRRRLKVGEYLVQWLDGRRDIRANTLAGYRGALKPVVDYLGHHELQKLTKAHVDDLVALRMSGGGKEDPRRLTARSREVLGYVERHRGGVTYGQILADLGEPGVRVLDRLLKAGHIIRPTRGRYLVAPAQNDTDTAIGGVSPQTVVTMLTVLTSALDAAIGQGYLSRNVARLVERPKIPYRPMSTWTAAESETFRRHVQGRRDYALWLLTLGGLRRSEVLGLAWSAVDLDASTISIVKGRTVVGKGTVVDDPKTARSRRVLPLSPVVVSALRTFKAAQAAERLVIGAGWPDTGLVAVNADGSPIRPETYSADFKRLSHAAGVPVIRLHDVRHTSVSVALDAGLSPTAVAAWHGHDPAVTLRVYGHAYEDALAAVGATIFARAADE